VDGNHVAAELRRLLTAWNDRNAPDERTDTADDAADALSGATVDDIFDLLDKELDR
jgi:hypothetical protein